jgi:uncharacterized protein DUF5681
MPKKTPKKGTSSGSEVGYRKPPEHSQFKPGKSGNLKGRPKGTKNLKTDLMEELDEKILVHEGDQPRRMSKQRAIVKSLVNRTLKGDARAASSLLSTIMKLIDTGAGEEPEGPAELHPDELEVLEAYEQQLIQFHDKKTRRGGRR